MTVSRATGAAEVRFPAMGIRAHVIVRGGEPGHVALAMEETARLDRLWSRFDPGSELSRVNASPGVPVRVSDATLDLAERAVQGWRMTAGSFDPTLLDEIVAAGYDRDFAELERAAGGPAPSGAPRARSGRSAPGIEIDRAAGTIRVAPERGLDSGGIGKGLAADRVAAAVIDAGALGALVNLGGDLAVAGEAPAGDWRIGVDDPIGGRRSIGRLRLHEGAVATSSSQARRWRHAGRDQHHLLDPRTGLPAESDLAAVTVVADRGWRAEVIAKAAFLADAGGAAAVIAAHDATGILVGRDGELRRLPGMHLHLGEGDGDGDRQGATATGPPASRTVARYFFNRR